MQSDQRSEPEPDPVGANFPMRTTSDLTRVGEMLAEYGYIRDGHKVNVKIGDGYVECVVTCPGDGCESMGRDGSCAVKGWADEAGMEFMEWQNAPQIEAELPCDIEYRWEGNEDDAELFWRPLPKLLSEIETLRYQRDACLLCFNCGEVSHAVNWNYLQRDIDTGELRPTRDGESDPICVCPVCAWEHVDNDDNPGIGDGTWEECRLDRNRALEDWSDRWIDVAKDRCSS